MIPASVEVERERAKAALRRAVNDKLAVLEDQHLRAKWANQLERARALGVDVEGL